ncbi:MAG: hypothetical protein HFH62_11540 [Lachnospiraceae bacterium]|nr:hypothetical protein [Lachnospiraceae bacterium]
MEVIITLIVSAFGCQFCNMDFCTLYTFISAAGTLHKGWINYVYDKATRQ